MKKYSALLFILFLSLSNCIYAMSKNTFTENVNSIKYSLSKELDSNFAINIFIAALTAITSQIQQENKQNTQAYQEFTRLNLSDHLEYLGNNQKHNISADAFDTMRNTLAEHNITCDNSIKTKRQQILTDLKNSITKKFSVAIKIKQFMKWNKQVAKLFPIHVYEDQNQQSPQKDIEFYDETSEIAQKMAQLKKLKEPKKITLPQMDTYQSIKNELKKLKEYNEWNIWLFTHKIKTALNTQPSSCFYTEDVKYLNDFKNIFLKIQFPEDASYQKNLQEQCRNLLDVNSTKTNTIEKTPQSFSKENKGWMALLSTCFAYIANFFQYFK